MLWWHDHVSHPAVWLVLRYLPPRSLSLWLHPASLCHSSCTCVPTLYSPLWIQLLLSHIKGSHVEGLLPMPLPLFFFSYVAVGLILQISVYFIISFTCLFSFISTLLCFSKTFITSCYVCMHAFLILPSPASLVWWCCYWWVSSKQVWVVGSKLKTVKHLSTTLPRISSILCIQAKGIKLLDRRHVFCGNSSTQLLFINFTQILQDWSKAGQYEQAVAAAPVQRRKEAADRLRDSEGSPGSQGYTAASHPEDSQRPRMTPATIAAKVILDDMQKTKEWSVQLYN